MSQQLEAGTYEIIRSRLEKQGQELQIRLEKLNTERKEVFGAVDTKLIATERISTNNNCVPRDMISVGSHFIFGYNVHFGLKSEASLEDVFSLYEYQTADHSFHQRDLNLLRQESFETDFRQLYQYYKDTVFAKFHQQGPFLYMIFRVGKSATDIKAFKWAVQGDGSLQYLDARSDAEVTYPPQHEFEWQRTSRDFHRNGAHPHISIQDRLFVETIGGDLTIKVEDNTATGEGIYAEPVDHAEQTLDDAEISFANLGNLILLKIKPYQEKNSRYLVYNEKLKAVKRLDAIADSCVLLPDDQGILFSNGYYLQNGEGKLFETELADMKFERRIASPNGEDVLFVFYNRLSGDYILLSYNSIEQQVDTPIHCHGYSLFKSGQLIYFKTDEEPKKVHAIQLWQTPYVHPDYELPVSDKENYLYKIGNKDIVRGHGRLPRNMAAFAEGKSLRRLVPRSCQKGDLHAR